MQKGVLGVEDLGLVPVPQGEKARRWPLRCTELCVAGLSAGHFARELRLSCQER